MMNSSADADTFVVFVVDNHLLALPISAVVKVVNRPSPSSGLEATGLVHLGHFTIPLLNLHQVEGTGVQTNSPFLVVARWFGEELWAIPVDEPPNLVRLSSNCVRDFPKSFDRDGFFKLVSQVAILTEEEKTATIFLLDTNRVVKSFTTRPQIQASSTTKLIQAESQAEAMD